MVVYSGTNLQFQSPFIPGEDITVGGYFNLTAGLASGDTIVFSQMVPPGGISAVACYAYCSQLDSNAAPLGKYEVGDSGIDGNGPNRYITGANMGSNVAGALVVTHSNVVPTFAAGVQTKGVGYFYSTDENSPTNDGNGYLDLVVTVTTSPATASASGTVWVYFTYKCVGNI